MADTKISALPSATLPLAGTEPTVVVQGGVTSQAPASALGSSRFVLLGTLTGANFNSTADQAISLTAPSALYVITQILVTNTSTSLTTAKGTFYAGASKTNAIFGATTSSFTALTASGSVSMVNSAATTFGGAFANARFTAGTTIYLSLTTAQGATATADVYVFGINLA